MLERSGERLGRLIGTDPIVRKWTFQRDTMGGSLSYEQALTCMVIELGEANAALTEELVRMKQE